MLHHIISSGPSVVVALKDTVVVVLAGSVADQEAALERAAKFPSRLAGVYGLPDGRDVAIFDRESNTTQIATRRSVESLTYTESH